MSSVSASSPATRPSSPLETATVAGGNPHLLPLTIDSVSAMEWVRRGKSLTTSSSMIEVDGRSFTRIECFIEAIRLDARVFKAWFQLAHKMNPSGTVSINEGSPLTQQDCYLQAMKVGGTLSSSAWQGLGTTLSDGEVVQVDAAGGTFSQQQCFLEGLKLNVKDGRAWFNLGNAMHSDDHHFVNDFARSKRECLIESLKLDPEFGRPWSVLASTVGQKELITVNGIVYDKQQCCIKALTHMPQNHRAWIRLSTTMDSPTTKKGAAAGGVHVNGKTYTRLQCITQALMLNAKNAKAWRQLADALATEAVAERGHNVMINDAVYDAQQCLVEAMKLQ